jgi:hypothetical protein
MEIRMSQSPLYNLTVDSVADGAAADTQLLIVSETLETLFKVVGLEGKVAVQLYNEIPYRRFQDSVTVLKGLNNAASRFASPSIDSVYRPDPRQLFRVSIDNFTGLVPGPIINNHPFLRPHSLRKQGLNRAFYIVSLISCWCDNDVFWRVDELLHTLAKPDLTRAIGLNLKWMAYVLKYIGNMPSSPCNPMIPLNI